MRTLIGKEKPPRSIWDLKLMPGGLIDLEFMTQYAAITGQAGIKTVKTSRALANLKIEKLSADQRDLLVAAHLLFANLTQVLRLCLKGDPENDDLPEGLLEIMCRVSELPDGKTLKAHVKNTAQEVKKIFDHVLR